MKMQMYAQDLECLKLLYAAADTKAAEQEFRRATASYVKFIMETPWLCRAAERFAAASQAELIRQRDDSDLIRKIGEETVQALRQAADLGKQMGSEHPFLAAHTETLAQVQLSRPENGLAIHQSACQLLTDVTNDGYAQLTLDFRTDGPDGKFSWRISPAFARYRILARQVLNSYGTMWQSLLLLYHQTVQPEAVPDFPPLDDNYRHFLSTFHPVFLIAAQRSLDDPDTLESSGFRQDTSLTTEFCLTKRGIEYRQELVIKADTGRKRQFFELLLHNCRIEKEGHMNPGRPIALAELANLCGYNPPDLSRRFREYKAKLELSPYRDLITLTSLTIKGSRGRHYQLLCRT